MVVDESNHVYVVGMADAGGNRNLKVIAYDSGLNIKWVNYIDLSEHNDEGTGICLDNEGDVVITGFSEKPGGGTNFIVAKYDATTGVQIWENSRTAVVDEHQARGQKIISDVNGNIFAVGEIQHEDWSKDFTIMAFRPDGTILFVKDLDISGNDKAQQVLLSEDAIFISGISDSAGTKEATSVKLSVLNVNQSLIFCDGLPCAVDDEIIVRFNPDDLILSSVDNVNNTFGFVGDFVEASAIADINTHLGFDLARQECYKIHPNLTSSDTTSISRFGNVVALPSFFATFGVILPQGSDDSLVVDSLNHAIPHVLIATINSIGVELVGADDPFFNDGQSAGLTPSAFIPDANINIEPAWDFETGYPGVIVGVYDGGINSTHEELSFGTFATSSVTNGYDYANSAPITATPDPDDKGHGSAVAGIIAAWRDNTTGVAGVAGGPIGFGGVSLHDMKINQIGPSCATSFAPLSTILAAMADGYSGVFLPQQDVQNHSWTLGGSNPLLHEMFIKAFDNEIIMCAAAGNGAPLVGDPCALISFPSAYKDHMLMKVGANDATGERASFSQCGTNLDFIAPGTNNLYVCLGHDGDDYTDDMIWATCSAPINGTSFAAPHAVGTVALMESYAQTNFLPNSFSHEDCEQLIEKSATNAGVYEDETGYGRIDAGNLFNSIEFPEYRVEHLEFTVPGSTGFISSIVEKTCLEQSLFGLPIGPTFVNRFEIVASNTHSIPAGYTLIDAWARGSGSTTIGDNSVFLGNPCLTSIVINYLPAEQDAELISFSPTGVTMRGFVYELLDNSFAHQGWWPFDPAITTFRFAYTLYMKDESVLNIEKPEDDLFKIYPNPADGLVYIEVGSEMFDVNIELTDITGKLIKIVASGVNLSANQIVLLDTEAIASGVYIVLLKTKDKCVTTKLIIE